MKRCRKSLQNLKKTAVENVPGSENSDEAATESNSVQSETVEPSETDDVQSEAADSSDSGGDVEGQQSPELKTRSKKKKKHAKDHLSEKEIERRMGLLVSDFSACGRCSYFLTGYRVVHGKDGVETAVSTQKGKWLKLEWNHAMRDLISKSYGVLLNVDFYHYDSCCSECSRRFTLKTIEKKKHQFKELRIEISN